MKVEYPEGSEPRTEAPETTTKARVQATSRRTPQVRRVKGLGGIESINESLELTQFQRSLCS